MLQTLIFLLDTRQVGKKSKTKVGKR